MLADKPHLMHLRDSGSRGRVLSVQEPILEQLQADLCSHNLCLVNTHNIKHYTHKTIFARLLECAHSFVEDYVGLPQFTHRPILPCVQTIQLPGSSALCKPLEKRPSLHSLNFQDCTIWWKPLKTLSYSHGFTIGQQFSSVNVTKINLFGNIGDTETLL